MPWSETCAMDERMRFVASLPRRPAGGVHRSRKFRETRAPDGEGLSKTARGSAGRQTPVITI